MRFIMALLILSASFAAVDAQADPAARTQGMVDVMKAIVNTESGELTADQKAGNCKRYAELDGFFDYDAIIKTALSSVSAKMSAKEVSEFNVKFKELIRMIAYPDSGRFFRSAKSTVAPAKVKGKSATVVMESSIEEEDFRNSVTYTWVKSDADWRITDIAFDGASLLKDYQNQFKRIVDKEGSAGLLKRLNAKYKDEQAKRTVCGS